MLSIINDRVICRKGNIVLVDFSREPRSTGAAFSRGERPARAELCGLQYELCTIGRADRSFGGLRRFRRPPAGLSA